MKYRFDLAFGEVPPRTDPEQAEMNRPDTHSDQPNDWVPDNLHHAPDLAISALVDRHFEHGRGLVVALTDLGDPRFGGLARLARQGDSTAQVVECLRRRCAFDDHAVGLSEGLAGVGDLVDKLAIVGEDDQPFGVGIETACRFERNSG